MFRTSLFVILVSTIGCTAGPSRPDDPQAAADSGGFVVEPDSATVGDSAVTLDLCEDFTGFVFARATRSVSESAGQIEIEVRRCGDTSTAASVGVSTNYLGDETDRTVTNAAEDQAFGFGADYIGNYGVLDFDVGVERRTLPVTILDDSAVEPDLIFEVYLYDATLPVGDPSVLVVTIKDDDGPASDASPAGDLGTIANDAGLSDSATVGPCVGSNCTTRPYNTGWPLEVVSWDLAVAYPGVPYEWRLAVIGGVYPYTFALKQAPSGMTIDKAKGIIRWTPQAQSAGNTVQVSITDWLGATLTHTTSIDVTTSEFVFVASQADGGDDSNAGTFASPWRTMAKAMNAAGDKVVYVRRGVHDVSTVDMKGSHAHRWIAYPTEAVTLDFGGTSVGINRSKSVVMGFELRNGGAKMFWASGKPKGLVWRRNTMHGVSSTQKNNPAFVFFEDGDGRPAEGNVQYDQVVFQENTFYDLTSQYNHGASITCYNVQKLLYEDNEAYDIDGSGVSDKDDGHHNTIRNNVLHDVNRGIGLFNQYTQTEIEVSHNLVYKASIGIEVGGMPGYIRDIYVHHNVLVNTALRFAAITDCATCGNFNVGRNIFSSGDGALTYELKPVSVSSGGYRYPTWAMAAGDSWIDENVVWNNGSDVAGYSWGLTNLSASEWQGRGFDANSLFSDPQLDADYALPAGSPLRGVYGRW